MVKTFTVILQLFRALCVSVERCRFNLVDFLLNQIRTFGGDTRL